MMITLSEVSKFPLFHTAGNKMSLSLAHRALVTAFLYRGIFSGVAWLGCLRTVVLNMNLIVAQSAKYFCVRKN